MTDVTDWTSGVTDWTKYLACDTIDPNGDGNTAPGCGAAAGDPCRYSSSTGAGPRLFPHTGRAMALPPELQPGPIWTNGIAPAADPRRVECPVWCTRHEHGMQTSEPHTLELLNLAVLDEDLTTDVPLQVVIVQDLEPGARPAVHLEIGHQLYQPTGVSLSRSDRARLASVLLTANHLTQQ